MALHYLQAGCDFYGRPTTAIWFHIPQAHRRRIMPLLLGNTFGQFANQATRCVYNTFDAQYSYPGSLWTRSSCTTLPPPLPLPLPLPRPLPLPLPLTSVFFGQNFLCALAGVLYRAVQEQQLRRSQPNLFPPPDDSGGLFQRPPKLTHTSRSLRTVGVPASCVPYVPKARGSLLPGRHALYARRTRTSLGRAVRTA